MSGRKGKPLAATRGGAKRTGINAQSVYNHTPILLNCQICSNVLHLLDRAIWLHFRAILDGDFTKAGKHRRVYLALLPLAILEVGR